MSETPKPGPPPKASMDVRLALVSALFVALGLALRDEVPWYATAFFGVCLAIALLPIRPDWWRDRWPPAEQLTIDDVGVTRTAKKLREHVAWKDIARVRIMTTDAGPQFEDVFFILESKDGSGCVVAHDLAVRGGLLDALQSRLEGVDNARVIEAMMSTEKQIFTIWEAESS